MEQTFTQERIPIRGRIPPTRLGNLLTLVRRPFVVRRHAFRRRSTLKGKRTVAVKHF